MTRHTETVLTFKLKVKMPKESNTHQMQLYLREILEKHSDMNKEDFTLALMKKETSYA